jgi:hypothetical protein
MNRILVISSCTSKKKGTSKKKVKSPNELTLDDFRDRNRLAQRESELKNMMLPAREMYAGQQHVHLLCGLKHLRQRYVQDFVSLAIVSAGCGLIAENRLIAPYEATFSDMGLAEARTWAKQLTIPEDVSLASGTSDMSTRAGPILSFPSSKPMWDVCRLEQGNLALPHAFAA